MEKKSTLKRVGGKKYDRMLKMSREWHHKHPDRAKAFNDELNRKGGKYYEKGRLAQSTGIQGERNKVRRRDGNRFRKHKRFFAQESQIHHQWIPGTAEHTGIALVEKDKHMHGIIDVIFILAGEITLSTEERLHS